MRLQNITVTTIGVAMSVSRFALKLSQKAKICHQLLSRPVKQKTERSYLLLEASLEKVHVLLSVLQTTLATMVHSREHSLMTLLSQEPAVDSLLLNPE